MEKAALRDARRMADVINGRRRIALAADYIERRIQEPDLGCVARLACHALTFHTNRYDTYRLVGIRSTEKRTQVGGSRSVGRDTGVHLSVIAVSCRPRRKVRCELTEYRLTAPASR